MRDGGRSGGAAGGPCSPRSAGAEVGVDGGRCASRREEEVEEEGSPLRARKGGNPLRAVSCRGTGAMVVGYFGIPRGRQDGQGRMWTPKKRASEW